VNWADERFVRLYVRDTVAWASLPWESRCVLPLVLRKLDRAGVLELGDLGMEGLAGLIAMPPDIVDRGMAKLIARGTFSLRDGWLLMPHFIDAQESSQSDKLRQAESRARRAEMAATVTIRDVQSQNVTDCHESSQPVTTGHSVPSVPCRDVKKNGADAPPLALELVPPPPPKQPRRSKLPAEPTEHAALKGELLALYAKATNGRVHPWGAKEQGQLGRLITLAGDSHAEVLKRGRTLWTRGPWPGYAGGVCTLGDLLTHWARLVDDPGRASPGVDFSGIRIRTWAEQGGK
jgi:hypothetical protein